jgi:hypothetical protein
MAYCYVTPKNALAPDKPKHSSCCEAARHLYSGPTPELLGLKLGHS